MKRARNRCANFLKRNQATTIVDLCKCSECGMSNPVLVEHERPKQCEWCGSSLESGITATPDDFKAKKVKHDEETGVGTLGLERLVENLDRCKSRHEAQARGGQRNDSKKSRPHHN